MPPDAPLESRQRSSGSWLAFWRWFPLGSDLDTYETDQPWVVYHYRTSDQRTRITGRSIIDAECAICGKRERLRMRIPRVGPVPEPKGGKHVERLRFLRDHVHPDRPAQMAWARPLLNAWASGPLDLDALAMRLEADLRDAQS